jgi:hypothetical protein
MKNQEGSMSTAVCMHVKDYTLPVHRITMRYNEHIFLHLYVEITHNLWAKTQERIDTHFCMHEMILQTI